MLEMDLRMADLIANKPFKIGAKLKLTSVICDCGDFRSEQKK